MITTRADFHKIIDLSLPGAEVGSASGIFAIEILSWGISKLYMIDIWEHIPSIQGMAGEPQSEHDRRYKEAVERVKGYPAVLMKGLSKNMAKRIHDNSLGFVYLDACHAEKDVFEDLQTWVPKLVKGGVLGMHDFADQNYGVKRAAERFCYRKYKIIELPEDGKIENGGAYFIKE
jgi:hypothetical protein